MYVLQPIEITSALIGAGATLAEDPSPAWMSGTTYTVGTEVHVVSTHRVYKDAVGGVSTVSPNLDDGTRWVDMRPTNKMAPFDIYTSTAATSTTTDIVYPITARFVNAIAIYGIVGANYDITIKDSAGGSVIWQRSGTLKRHDRGWYNYLFGRRTQVRKLVFFGLPMRPAAEITVTISSTGANQRAVGMIAMGKLRPLMGALPGGTEVGASAEPVSYSYIKQNEDGTTKIVRRHSGTNLKCRVFIQQSQADNAVNILQDVLDIPVAWIATETEGYAGLSTFGIASSTPVQYQTPHAYIDINVRGLI